MQNLARGEEPNNGIIVKPNIMYFSTTVEHSAFNYTLKIYKSNIYGTELSLVFSKDGYKTHPWAYGRDNYFYILHYLRPGIANDESKMIDRYSIDDSKYENVDSGKDCSLSNYKKEEIVSSIASYYLGEHLISGVSSVYGGMQTIATGISLLAYTIGKSGVYIVKKFPNDHYPAHIHIFGDDINDKLHGIRIGLDGNPLPGQEKLPPGARKALKKLWQQIIKAFL